MANRTNIRTRDGERFPMVERALTFSELVELWLCEIGFGSEITLTDLYTLVRFDTHIFGTHDCDLYDLYHSERQKIQPLLDAYFRYKKREENEVDRNIRKHVVMDDKYPHVYRQDDDRLRLGGIRQYTIAMMTMGIEDPVVFLDKKIKHKDLSTCVEMFLEGTSVKDILECFDVEIKRNLGGQVVI